MNIRRLARVKADFRCSISKNAAVLDVAGASLLPNRGDDEAFLRPQAVRAGCGCGVIVFGRAAVRRRSPIPDPPGMVKTMGQAHEKPADG